MTESELLVNTSHGVTRLTLDRPKKRNALSHALLQDLLQAVTAAASDPAVRVIVLDATGAVFSAGMDLTEMQQAAESSDAETLWQRDAQLFRDVLTGLFTAAKPTVAVVGGPVFAGGAGLVLACDLVLATEEADFALPEPQRGITASLVTPLLAYRAGAGAASFSLLSGERISADQAARFGIYHDIAPTDELKARCDRLIASILTGAPEALANTKRELIETAGANVITQLDTAIAASAVARQTAAAREGLAAFLEKRRPNWQVDPASSN